MRRSTGHDRTSIADNGTHVLLLVDAGRLRGMGAPSVAACLAQEQNYLPDATATFDGYVEHMMRVLNRPGFCGGRPDTRTRNQ